MNPGLGPGPRPAEGEAAAPPGGQACTLGAVGGALGPQHRRPPGEGRWRGRRGQLGGLCALPPSHTRNSAAPPITCSTYTYLYAHRGARR